MNIDKKDFKDLLELGSFLKKHRRLKGEKIENIAKKLLIKKRILTSFEEGQVTFAIFKQESYLKGFLISYVKYLGLDQICNLDILQQKKISNLNKSNLQLEVSGEKHNNSGSIIILLSLILIGLTYLIWSKQTYIQLYLLGVAIN